jgi:hypothetical protein
MPTKHYCTGPVGRAVYMGVIVLGVANILSQLVSLLQHLGSQAEEHIPLGTHAGASLFLIAVSAVWILFGVSGLTARLDVDALGMRQERAWFSPGLDVPWDAITAWAIQVVVTTYTSTDEWGGGTSTTEKRNERLEIAMSRPPWRITRHPNTAFYREIVDALRAQVPDKEGSLPIAKA